MLLSEKIKGFGFALSCDFLKECGFKEYLKPDTHIISVFEEIHKVDKMSQWECYIHFINFLDLLNENFDKKDEKNAYEVDKIFWLNCKVSKNKKNLFLKEIENILENKKILN